MLERSFGNGWEAFLIRCLFLFLACSSAACDESRRKGIEEMKVYYGPVIESRNIVSLYSDSARIKIRLEGAKQAQYENGNIDYPEGVKITFYDRQQQAKATLDAQQGAYQKDQDLYKVWGKVVVRDLRENKSLQTEELFWKPRDKQIYTEKFVIITTPTEIIKGEGLIANEDFSYYEIKKPRGVVSLE